MGRSTRVVVLLLIATMALLRVAAIGCEISCLGDASSRTTATAQAEAPEPGARCHDATSGASPQSTHIALRTAHTRCGHEAARLPTVAAVKTHVVSALRILDATVLTAACAATRVRQQLRQLAPPGLQARPGAPLRI